MKSSVGSPFGVMVPVASYKISVTCSRFSLVELRSTALSETESRNQGVKVSKRMGVVAVAGVGDQVSAVGRESHSGVAVGEQRDEVSSEASCTGARGSGGGCGRRSSATRAQQSGG